MDKLEVNQFGDPTAAQAIRQDIAIFHANLDQDGRIHVEVNIEPWQNALQAMAKLIIDPPWQLRKKLRVRTGHLEGYEYERLLRTASMLTRHRSCSDRLYLDGHG